MTSRARLNLEGELLVPLDPLPVDEAVRLFEDRARAARPGFRITDADRPTVEEIVERLDCMSLAVELAAARVRVLSPEKLLARLSQRFKLLSSGRRDQTARQATLRGAIDWSWELLQPWEQAAISLENESGCEHRSEAIKKLAETKNDKVHKILLRWDDKPKTGCSGRTLRSKIAKDKDCYACIRDDLAAALEQFPKKDEKTQDP